MEHVEEADRTLILYRLLVEAIIVGNNTIGAELEKPKTEQDVYYMLGQVELSAMLTNAAIALENSGLIDEDDMVCHGCGGQLTEHDDNAHASHSKVRDRLN